MTQITRNRIVQGGLMPAHRRNCGSGVTPGGLAHALVIAAVVALTAGCGSQSENEEFNQRHVVDYFGSSYGPYRVRGTPERQAIPVSLKGGGRGGTLNYRCDLEATPFDKINIDAVQVFEFRCLKDQAPASGVGGGAELTSSAEAVGKVDSFVGGWIALRLAPRESAATGAVAASDAAFAGPFPNPGHAPVPGVKEETAPWWTLSFIGKAYCKTGTGAKNKPYPFKNGDTDFGDYVQSECWPAKPADIEREQPAVTKVDPRFTYTVFTVEAPPESGRGYLHHVPVRVLDPSPKTRVLSVRGLIESRLAPPASGDLTHSLDPSAPPPLINTLLEALLQRDYLNVLLPKVCDKDGKNGGENGGAPFCDRDQKAAEGPKHWRYWKRRQSGGPGQEISPADWPQPLIWRETARASARRDFDHAELAYGLPQATAPADAFGTALLSFRRPFMDTFRAKLLEAINYSNKGKFGLAWGLLMEAEGQLKEYGAGYDFKLQAPPGGGEGGNGTDPRKLACDLTWMQNPQDVYQRLLGNAGGTSNDQYDPAGARRRDAMGLLAHTWMLNLANQIALRQVYCGKDAGAASNNDVDAILEGINSTTLWYCDEIAKAERAVWLRDDKDIKDCDHLYRQLRSDQSGDASTRLVSNSGDAFTRLVSNVATMQKVIGWAELEALAARLERLRGGVQKSRDRATRALNILRWTQLDRQLTVARALDVRAILDDDDAKASLWAVSGRDDHRQTAERREATQSASRVTAASLFRLGGSLARSKRTVAAEAQFTKGVEEAERAIAAGAAGVTADALIPYLDYLYQRLDPAKPTRPWNSPAPALGEEPATGYLDPESTAGRQEKLQDAERFVRAIQLIQTDGLSRLDLLRRRLAAGATAGGANPPADEWRRLSEDYLNARREIGAIDDEMAYHLSNGTLDNSRHLKNRREELTRDLQHAIDDLDKLAKKSGIRLPVRGHEAPTLAKIQESLWRSPKEAALAFVVGEEKGFGVLIGCGKLTIYRIDSGYGEIARLADGTRKLFARQNSSIEGDKLDNALIEHRGNRKKLYTLLLQSQDNHQMVSYSADDDGRKVAGTQSSLDCAFAKDEAPRIFTNNATIASQITAYEVVAIVPHGVLWSVPYSLIVTPDDPLGAEPPSNPIKPVAVSLYPTLAHLTIGTGVAPSDRSGQRRLLMYHDISSISGDKLNSVAPGLTTEPGNGARIYDDPREAADRYRDVLKASLAAGGHDGRLNGWIRDDVPSRGFTRKDLTALRTKSSIISLITHGFLPNSVRNILSGSSASDIATHPWCMHYRHFLNDQNTSADSSILCTNPYTAFLVSPSAPSGQVRSADDIMFDVRSVQRWDVDSDIIIVTACNSASTSVLEAGDGFIERVTTFLYAGGRSLLSTGWRIKPGPGGAIAAKVVAKLAFGDGNGYCPSRLPVVVRDAVWEEVEKYRMRSPDPSKEPPNTREEAYLSVLGAHVLVGGIRPVGLTEMEDRCSRVADVAN